MKSGYYQIRMGEVDVEKIALRIIYGSYEFSMMLFRLCNAPSTLTMLMNFIFHKKLDDFVIIYIDDIMEYSKSAKKHAMHLEFVLQKFK
jgi:hypothetical protein